MNLTPYLKLKKPLSAEKYDINIFNTNCDTIDSAVSNITDSIDHTIKETDKALKDLEEKKSDASLIGAANGIAPLDSDRKVPPTNIPFGTLSGTCFEGTMGKKLRDEFDAHTALSQSGMKNLEDGLATETNRATQTENSLREDLTNETVLARTAEKENADAIASETNRAKASEEQLESGISLLMQSTSAELKALQDANDTLATNKANKSDVEAALAERYTKGQTFSRQEVLDKIEALIGSAPDTLDTFREIAEALGNDPHFATTIMEALSGKVDKENGKALSSNDYTGDEKAKVQASYDIRHSHSNKTVLDKITQTFLDNWTDSYSKRHDHNNKGVLDGITSSLITAWNSAVTHASDAIKHITAAERTNWNDADSKKHTHNNKSILDSITQALLTKWNNVDNKVDKVSGKGLSTNDFTSPLLTKLNGIADGANNYTHPATSGNKHIPSGGSAGQILRWSADGTAAWGTDNNTTYSGFKGATASAAGTTGLVPAPAAGKQGQFLRGDGTWNTPANTTYGTATQTANGLMAAADKKKLDGIAAGAQVNSIIGVKGNAESSYRTGNVNLTPANIGAAASSHTHTKSQITDMPTAMKNPASLTIQTNGTSQGSYDGSSAKTINITAANVGAASSSHSHSTYENQNAFSNITVGSAVLSADSPSDTLTLVAGNNITLTPDVKNDKITIAATGGSAENFASKNIYGDTSVSLMRLPDTAIGTNSYAFGIYTTASGDYSHAEGNRTRTEGMAAHAEGYLTQALGDYSHAEGDKDFNEYDYTVGSTTVRVKGSTAYGTASHAEGKSTLAYGDSSHAEGICCKAIGSKSHAEGSLTVASGSDSHAEGSYTTASESDSHAEGTGTTASGRGAHAEGNNTTASDFFSHAQGNFSKALGYISHAEGNYTTASGSNSHSEGNYTTTSGESSHAEGDNTNAANYASHVSGKFNANMITGGNKNNTTGTAFAIGNGTSSTARSNAFSVMYTGVVKAKSTITGSTTADYAELFEWADGNPENKDNAGYFVTLDGDRLKYASEGDYILGVISGEPFVLGNSDCDTWNGMYLRDNFNRVIYERAPMTVRNEKTGEYEEVKDADGNTLFYGTRPVLNPDYNPCEPYVSRMDRPEWDPVGMLGVMSVYDDGTCEVNGYCKCNNNAIATKSDTGYRVIKRIDDNIIKIIFR